MRAVVLAGGRGTRLAPYTTVLPKPLMPVGDKPILEILINLLTQNGISRITLAVGHLASLLNAYFEDGTRFGVPIDYALEEESLGTAGPLKLVSGLNETFLVMNGDLLTDLDLKKMAATHRAQKAMATVGLFEREIKIDLGVIKLDLSQRIIDYVEKPVHRFIASMGVYLFEPKVLEYIPRKGPFDLPDLIRKLIADGQPVNSYTHTGYWLDIGRPDDYKRAQEDYESIKTRPS